MSQNRFGRNSDVRSWCRDVFGNDRTSSDNDVVANGNSWQNRGSRSYKDMGSDFHVPSDGHFWCRCEEVTYDAVMTNRGLQIQLAEFSKNDVTSQMTLRCYNSTLSDTDIGPAKN